MFKYFISTVTLLFCQIITQAQNEWLPLPCPTTNIVKCLYLHDSLIYISSGNGSKNEFHKSNDLGKTWETAKTEYEFRSMHFLNPNIGYAADYKGVVYTSDAGTTWERLFDNQSKSIYNGLSEVFFPDQATGYLVGGLYKTGTILKTTDSGGSWNIIADDIPAHLNDLFFFDSVNGFIFGNKGYIAKTHDGGENWTEQNSGSTESINAGFCIDENNIYAVGSMGTILHSADGGLNWTSQNSGTELALTSIYFIDSQTGYVAGGAVSHENGYPEPLRQIILKTNDGGKTWIQQSSSSNAIICALSFNKNNIGFAVGDFGTIIRTAQDKTDCNGDKAGSAFTDACGNCAGGNSGREACIVQEITLQAGWNLISLFAKAEDMSPETIWNSEISKIGIIKDFEKSWIAGNPKELNSLNELSTGTGYFVHATSACTVKLSGYADFSGAIEINQGWNLFGPRSISPQTITESLKLNGISLIKNFDQFWRPDASGLLTNFEPGKGYIIYKQ